MRKTWIIAMAAAAVALAGCVKEVDGPAAGDGILRAAIENPTRVSFSDEGVFAWQAGDAVAVVTNAGNKVFTLTQGAGGASASFEGDLTGITAATAGIYPAAIAKDASTVTLPAEYAWAEGQSNAAMYCQQVDLSKVNSFKHLGGILKISYKEIPAEANALLLTAGAKITGDFAINEGVISVSENSVSQVKVTFAAGSNPAAFYIPVPTGEIKFQVELLKDGAAIDGTLKATTMPVKIDRKSLVLMDPIEGAGEEGLIIEIATAEDFIQFVADSDNYAAKDEAILKADITLPETFVPDTLRCNFDGQGHTVTYNMTLPKALEVSAGLFSYAEDGITVKNLNVAGSMNTEKANAGGIVGKAGKDVTFESCTSAVNILGPIKVTYHMGGIVGDADSGVILRNCRNLGSVETVIPNFGTSNASQLGGMVGHIGGSGTLEDCVNKGVVRFDGKGTARIGGIAGYMDGADQVKFIRCINEGPVTARGFKASQYAYAGGIAGYFNTGVEGCTVLYDSCINRGAVTSDLDGGLENAIRTGGIAALAGKGMAVTFRNCENYGNVISNSTSASNQAGGIVAYSESTCVLVVDGCTNESRVETAGKGQAAAIVGASGSPTSVYTNFTVGPETVVSVVDGAGAIAVTRSETAASGETPAALFSTAMTGKVAGTVIKNGVSTVLTAENYKDFVYASTLGEGGSIDGVVFNGGEPETYPAPMEQVSAGAMLDPTALPGDWNVLGNNSTKNGIYVLGGTGSDPRLVCPYDKTWDWNDSVYRESDNVLTIAMTGISGTTINGTANWWSGADGKFWDYIWNFSDAEKPEYEPYKGTDLSNFYNKIPKGNNAVSIDIATMTATLSNGETPKLLTPGVYKFCEGLSGQVLTVPDGCFALKFHLGNMQVQAGDWYGKDIDRFMMCPLEYIIIFEKEGGSTQPEEPGEAVPIVLETAGAALSPDALAGSWNVLGDNSTKNGIFVIGGSGSDPRKVCPYEKTWCWNDSIYNESDNGLSVAVTSMEGTTVKGTTNWWAGNNGKWWDYIWNWSSQNNPEKYDQYKGTDLSKYYNKIPKGKYEFTLDLSTMTATLNNGQKPKILTPGVYKICDGDGTSQHLTVPDGCFAMQFHLGNMHKEMSEHYGLDIDRFLFYPLEYVIIFEK